MTSGPMTSLIFYTRSTNPLSRPISRGRASLPINLKRDEPRDKERFLISCRLKTTNSGLDSSPLPNPPSTFQLWDQMTFETNFSPSSSIQEEIYLFLKGYLRKSNQGFVESRADSKKNYTCKTLLFSRKESLRFVKLEGGTEIYVGSSST